MKRLVLITLMLVTIALAGVLHGNYTQQESVEGTSLEVAYGTYYPDGIANSTLFPLTTIPF